MALGAFSPLPFRLGGSDKGGLPAVSQSRMAADLAAVKRSTPFAVITGILSSSTFTIEAYNGRDGVGVAAAPTVAQVTASSVTFTWSANHEDPYERRTPINMVHGEATVHGSSAKCATVSFEGRAAAVVVTDSSSGALSEGRFTLEVYTDEGAHFADYGGDPDKEDSPEGHVPYAALWYNELKAMRGGAFSVETGTLVHAEHLAISRIMSAVYSRTPEKRVNNSSPVRADEKLPEWIRLLRVPVAATDRDYQIRKRLAAKFRIARGPTFDNENEALRELLGDIFVQAHRIKGSSLGTPPSLTHWQGGDPGPSAYDLGGGAWISERAHLFVEVTQPADGDLSRFNELTRRQLFELLNDLVPAWVTFDFATSDGFLLDISDMDFDGMD